MTVLELAGTTLYYEVVGDWTPVVLVHGLALDARMWDEQIPALSDIATVIRCDARGFGRSVRHGNDISGMQAIGAGLQAGGLPEAKAAWLRHGVDSGRSPRPPRSRWANSTSRASTPWLRCLPARSPAPAR